MRTTSPALPHVSPRTVIGFPLVSRMHMVSTVLTTADQLKDRIEVKKHALLKSFAELKADTRADAIKARDRVKAKLDELELYLKNGWDKVTAETHTKLDEWLHKD